MPHSPFIHPLVAFAAMQVAVVAVVGRRIRWAAALPLAVAAVAFGILGRVHGFRSEGEAVTGSALVGILAGLVTWCVGEARSRGGGGPTACTIPVAIALLFALAQSEFLVVAGREERDIGSASSFAFAYTAAAMVLSALVSGAALMKPRRRTASTP